MTTIYKMLKWFALALLVAAPAYGAVSSKFPVAVPLLWSQMESNPSLVVVSVSGINFNSAGSDTAFNITLPAGFTRYNINSINISNASGTLTTATVGVFTSPGGAGTAIVTSGTAVTVNTASENTTGNSMSLGVNNGSTASYNLATLYFRVVAAEGSAATATVSMRLSLLP